MKKRIRIGRDTIFLLVGGVLCITLLASGLSLFFGGSLAQAQKPSAAAASRVGGEDETGPYEVASGWPQPLGHPGFTWGSQGGVFAESPNRIYIANRGELPIPEKSPEGYTGGCRASGQPVSSSKTRMDLCILAGEANVTLPEART